MLWIINDPASSDNCEAEAIKMFEKYYLFNKDEVISSLECHLEFMQKEKTRTKFLQMKMYELYERFLATVKKSDLPDLLPENWRCYEYEFVGNGIVLKITEVEEIGFSDDELDTITVTDLEEVFFESCEYVSVEEFAQIHSVKEKTVMQWINKGKLKNAKLEGDRWLIPSVEEKPKKERIFSDYYLKAELHLDEFPYVQFSDSIDIRELDTEIPLCQCILRNYSTGFHEEVIMTKKEAERLEYLLIASGKAKNMGYMY